MSENHGSVKRPFLTSDRWRAAGAFAFALAAVLLMGLARWSLHPLLGDRAAYTFFMFSAMAAAWYGGLWPGLLALALGLLAGDYFFMPPRQEIGLHSTVEAIQYVIYLVPTFFAVLLFEALHRTRRRLEDAATQLQRELKERAEIEAALREAKDQLRDHASNLETRVAERTRQLEETMHSLETFSYNVAHNLRAPLRALHGISHAVLEDYGGVLDTVGRGYLERIRDSAVKMDALICDLLGYDQTSREEVKLVAVDLNGALSAALHSVEGQVRESGALIAKSSELPSVLAQREMLQHVLTNLLSNALKFVEPGRRPEIQISARIAKGRVRLSVADNGIGIDQRHHERIFGIFERVCDFDYPGNGIGLAVARLAVQRMGGAMGVISSPGNGSTFWVELNSAAPESTTRLDQRLREAEIS